MLSKALKNCSKIFYNCSNQSREVWSNAELLYQPKNPLDFKNGRCLLFLNEQYQQARFGFWVLFGLGGTISYFSAKRLYNYQDRSWYGMLFYTVLIGSFLYQSRKVSRHFKRLIITLDLLPCGRNVLLTHPNAFGLRKELKVDISRISRPKDVNEYIYQMQLVFPVVFDQQLFYLQRDPDYIMNKEILPAVMNAKYIKVD